MKTLEQRKKKLWEGIETIKRKKEEEINRRIKEFTNFTWIKCPNCKHEYSNNLDSCPQCEIVKNGLK